MVRHIQVKNQAFYSWKMQAEEWRLSNIHAAGVKGHLSDCSAASSEGLHKRRRPLSLPRVGGTRLLSALHPAPTDKSHLFYGETFRFTDHTKPKQN